jgi:hypothetical protein
MSFTQKRTRPVNDLNRLGSERNQPSTLRAVFGDFKLKEMVRLDLGLGVLGGVGGLVLGLKRPDLLISGVPAVAGLAGVVLGVVLATATLIAAFLNPVFLRKLRAIDEDPVTHLRPYLFTGLLAVIGSLGAICLAVSSSHAPPSWLAVAGAITGLATVWSLTSMIPNLANLIGFIRLQQDAAEVPDEHPQVQPLGQEAR